MKKSIKTICILLSVVLILFLLPSCKVQHFSESDISSWANKNIGKNVVISKDYIERPSSDEGYTDRVWTAYLKDRPDMKFEIISHEYWGAESVTHSIETTYGYIYGKYYFDEYLLNNTTDFVPRYTEPVTYDYYLTADFSDRDDLSDVIDQAEEISKFMIANDIDDFVRFTVKYDDILASVKETDVIENTGCSASLDDFEETLLTEYALYAADYRLDLDEFSYEELCEAVEKHGRTFEFIYPEGGGTTSFDVSLSRFGYGMSFGCLYEMLYTHGYPVYGTVDHYHFEGIDGSTYVFSYKFNNYEYENGEVGYYYVKDSRKYPMDYYFYNHLKSDFVKEICGYSFEEI